MNKLRKHPLFYALLIAGISFYFFGIPLPHSKLCTPDSEFKLMLIGGEVFNVPQRATAWKFIPNDNEQLINICHKKGSPPIEAISTSWFSEHPDDQLYKKYQQQDPDKKTSWSIGLRVTIRSSQQPLDIYTRFVEPILSKSHKNIKALPKENDFAILDDPNISHRRFYISTHLVDTKGTPRTFVCDWKSQQKGQPYSPSQCAGSIKWKDNIYFIFDNLSDAYVPVTKLNAFYSDFQDYMLNTVTSKKGEL